jgi:hypothetical protein
MQYAFSHLNSKLFHLFLDAQPRPRMPLYHRHFDSYEALKKTAASRALMPITAGMLHHLPTPHPTATHFNAFR